MATPKSSNGQESQHQTVNNHSILHNLASSILLLLLLLLLAGCLLIWLQVHPQRLYYTIEDVVVHDFAVSSAFDPKSNSTQERLRATFSVNFSAHNENHKVLIRYESIEMRVEYNDQVLAHGPVEPFVLAGRSNRSFFLSVRAANVTLLPSVGSVLKKIKEPSDPVKINVTMLTGAGVVVPHWRTDRRRLTVVCRDVTAHFPRNTMSSEKSDCYVDL